MRTSWLWVVPRRRGADLARQAAKARRNDVRRAVTKFTELRNGARRFIHQPPIIMGLDETFATHLSHSLRGEIINLFAEYLESLPPSVQQLVGGYELVDVALKVVGVGSVGTRCFVALAEGRDDDDLFIFQVKEAQESVVATYTDPIHYENQGQRVVAGQYLMQAATDQFLGWGHALGVDYYLRQFRDMKGGARLDRIDLPNAEGLMNLCAWTLARAHARSGDRIAISAYLGTGDRFDQAIRDFSMAYADQVALDYEVFREAGESGRMPVCGPAALKRQGPGRATGHTARGTASSAVWNPVVPSSRWRWYAHPGPRNTNDRRSRHEPAPGHVTGHVEVLVGRDPGRVERVDVLGQPVADRLVLGLEGAEEPVPHDQDAAVVAVEVLGVGAVVHPVVRRAC